MSGLLVAPTLLFVPPPPGGTPWPSSISAVGPRGSLGSAPASGTGWSLSGSVISTTASNAVIQGYNNVTGIILKHPGAHVADMYVDSGGPGTNDACIQLWSAATDCLIEYVELRNSFTAISPERTFSHGWTGDRLTVDHSLIQFGHENAINPGSDFTVTQTVFRRFGRSTAGGAPHYDGVESFGGENGTTIDGCVIFLTGDGVAGHDQASPIDSWLPDTGCINVVGTVDDYCMTNTLFGGGSSALNFGTGGADTITNVRIGKTRANVSAPCYYVRNSAGQFARDDPGLTIVGWDVFFAEDDGTNASTFDNTLTVDVIGSL